MTPTAPLAPVPPGPGSGALSPDAPGVVARGRGVVASTDRYASEVGREALGRGGNAVDATVATAFALAVVNPEAGNVGGGGFLLVRTAEGEEAALDHRSVAPRAATPDMFLEADSSSELGHLAVAVPGTVLGLWEAHRRLGRLSWADLVDPAVQLAQGFRVTSRLLRSYEPDVVEGLRRFPASAGIFLPGGEPPGVGTTFRQEHLARTLERVRDRGPEGFYRGKTADLLVAEMRRGGGVVDHQDLASYRLAWRDPVRFGYRDSTVVTMPPPSSGGVFLSQLAHMLAGRDLPALPWHGADHVHLLAEAWRRAFADRNHDLADPAFVDLPLSVLMSPAYGAWRMADFDPDRATPSADVGPGAEAWSGGNHTTHVSVVDPRGGAAALTTTLNTWYGSKVVAEGTGVLLNNEMDDFATRPGVPNYFGLVQGEANAIRAGKRPLSAMAPTLVLDGAGELTLVLGTPGGATILTTVFQILSNVLDHGMELPVALLAPRVHHQHLPDELRFEPGGLRAEVVEALEARGHRVVERDELSGDAQAVRVLPGGQHEGVSDPRRGGVALAV